MNTVVARCAELLVGVIHELFSEFKTGQARALGLVAPLSILLTALSSGGLHRLVINNNGGVLIMPAAHLHACYANADSNEKTRLNLRQEFYKAIYEIIISAS